jgi:hypothetical protein
VRISYPCGKSEKEETWEYASCGEAFAGIKSRTQKRRERIQAHIGQYKMANVNAYQDGENFWWNCEYWKNRIKDDPSSIIGYAEYLYRDCAALYRKYGRDK